MTTASAVAAPVSRNANRGAWQFRRAGRGATVGYLGIGNTLIEGRGRARHSVATPWPAFDRDANADRFPVRAFVLALPADAGARTLVLRHAAGLQPGDRLFLSQHATSMSSS